MAANSADFTQHQLLCEQISALLDDQTPETMGAVLADLTVGWLLMHDADDDEDIAAVRRHALEVFMSTVITAVLRA